MTIGDVAGRSSAEAEYQPKTAIDGSQEAAGDLAGALGEELAIERDDLRYVRDQVLRKTCGPRREQDVAGGLDQPEVAGEHDGNDGRDAAPVEGIGLHDQDGAAEPRPRAARLIELGPPDFSATNYQSAARRTVRPCARRSGLPTPPGSVP